MYVWVRSSEDDPIAIVLKLCIWYKPEAQAREIIAEPDVLAARIMSPINSLVCASGLYFVVFRKLAAFGLEFQNRDNFPMIDKQTRPSLFRVSTPAVLQTIENSFRSSTS